MYGLSGNYVCTTSNTDMLITGFDEIDATGAAKEFAVKGTIKYATTATNAAIKVNIYPVVGQTTPFFKNDSITTVSSVDIAPAEFTAVAFMSPEVTPNNSCYEQFTSFSITFDPVATLSAGNTFLIKPELITLPTDATARCECYI